MPGTLLAVERVAIAAGVTLTAVLFLPALADPVNVIKLTALLICALVAAVCGALRVLQERVLRLPRSAALYSALALLVCLVLVTATAADTTTAVVGTYGRNNGLLAYAAALLLFGVGTRAWDARSTPILLIALLLGGLFTAAYGLLQYRHIDPVNWNNPFNPIIAGLGNPDFASAYVGICVPAAFWGALWDGWARPWRVASAAVAALCLATAVLSSAIQGPAAAAAGSAVLAVAWLLNREGAMRRRGLAAVGVLAVLGAATVAAGAAHVGPLTSAFAGGGGQARTWYWQGAFSMLRSHPVLGVGLDHYGAHWREVRPDAATKRLGGGEFSDAAHSVPLQMLAEGGVVLGLVYVAFLLFVAVALVRGLRALDGQARLVLGAVGGVWFSYVVQAAVSIDQVPLLTVGFVTAGAIVALSGGTVRELRLPGAVQQPVQSSKGRRGRPAEPRRRAWTGADTAIAGGLLVAALIAFWFSLYPLRANAAVRSGDVALAAGDGNAALAAYQRATGLLPGAGLYWQKTGALYETVRQPAAALQAYREAVDHDPVDVTILMAAARLAGLQHDEALQGRLLHRAGRLDPTNPGTVLQVAAYDAGHGALPAASAAVDRALRALPSDADLWATKGEILVRRNDDAGARIAFERALALQPGHPVATSGLAALKTRS